MNIYLLTQNTVTGYDTYDSCVVVAVSAAKAKLIHPSEYHGNWDGKQDGVYDSWCDADKVTATLIGKASSNVKAGLILSSFNAG
jgi:hypothetical protein